MDTTSVLSPDMLMKTETVGVSQVISRIHHYAENQEQRPVINFFYLILQKRILHTKKQKMWYQIMGIKNYDNYWCI